MSQNEPGTMKGIDKPDDDSSVSENTEGTEWDLTEMSAAHLGGLEYRILSTRNNSINHYEVDIDDGTCSCPSELFNLREDEACPHLAKALLVHSHREPEQLAAQDLKVLSERARNLLWDLRDTTDWVETVIESEAAHAASDDVSSGGSSSGGSSGGSPSVNASEAAEKLQSAFNDVVDGINVEHSGGMVWVNKTPDAPDQLPGPGNVEVFEAFLQKPDALQYIHDDHELANDKPGRYFSNAIDPSDVDRYITEVLE